VLYYYVFTLLLLLQLLLPPVLCVGSIVVDVAEFKRCQKPASDQERSRLGESGRHFVFYCCAKISFMFFFNI
jgi:hypothetical protein